MTSLLHGYDSLNNESQQNEEFRQITVTSSATSSNDYLIKTNIFNEVKFIIFNATPLVLTFLMQYSLTVSCLFVIGRLCVDPDTGSNVNYLSSASLAVMTYNITGTAVIEGMSTSLDTFCSQAYGAGKFKKVGLYTQRCSLMIMCILTPIVFSWWYSSYWLKYLIPGADELLGNIQNYLRLLSFGLPAMVMFETGKRFVQSQGYYNITTFCLLFIFPTNFLLIYMLTSKYGFFGAPCAIIISDWLMFVLLFLYCIYIKPDTLKCWSPILKYEGRGEEENDTVSQAQEFSEASSLISRSVSEANVVRKVRNFHPIFYNWLPMWKLSFSGLVITESEYLAFELLTAMSTYLGVEMVAAQTIISTMGTLMYQIPFAFGCVISTRVARYIGSYYEIYYRNNLTDEQQPLTSNRVIDSKLPELNSKICIYASYFVGLILGICDFSLLYFFAEFFAGLFTKDKSVVKLSVQTLPILAIVQIPDTFNIFDASILRGQGRQSIGSISIVIAHYCIGLPLAYIFTFKAGLKLTGLWSGYSCGIIFLGIVQTFFVAKTNWQKVFNSFFRRLKDEEVGNR